MAKFFYIFLALFMSACSVIKPNQTLPAAKYYSIDLNNSFYIEKKFNKNILITRPKILLNTNEIFYKKDNSLNSYAYHFWQKNPSLMIKNFIEFHAMNAFKAVLNSDSLAIADLVLEGRIDTFVEEFFDDKSKVKFGINLILLDFKSKQIIANKYFYYEEDVKKDFISAYNVIFSKFGKDMFEWMEKNLE